MRILKTFAPLLLLATGTVAAHQTHHAAPASGAPMAQVSELMTQALKDYPGKEGKMILVTYPPGSVDPVHRHNAEAFVYVLEGHIEMGLNGKQPVTLGPGQTFHEGPADLHTVGRNASKTEPARFVVFLLKEQHAPVLIPQQ
ncbi:MAG: cupin domain-containing protein [Dyella sp.]|uniref:cupin domain-containing protein n=1 Tax=Dyella sp. TaxID=1869338 RepID=UPI003F7D15C6